MLKLLHWRKCQNIVLQLCYFIPKMISFVYWFNSYSILYLFHFNNIELMPQWAYKTWLLVCHSPTKILSSLCQNNLSTQSKHSSLIKNLEWQIARLHCLVIQLTRIIPSVNKDRSLFPSCFCITNKKCIELHLLWQNPFSLHTYACRKP